ETGLEDDWLRCGGHGGGSASCPHASSVAMSSRQLPQPTSARACAAPGDIMNRRFHPLPQALGIALAALPFASAASGAPTDLDQVVVTATRTEVSLRDSLVPVQVIDRAAIERSQATSLQELLRGRAGINVSNQGGPGKLSSLFVRGTAS